MYKIDDLDPMNNIHISFHFNASSKTKYTDKILDNSKNLWDAKLKKPLSHNLNFMEGGSCTVDFLIYVGNLISYGCDSYEREVGKYYFGLKECATKDVIEQFLNGDFYSYHI